MNATPWPLLECLFLGDDEVDHVDYVKTKLSQTIIDLPFEILSKIVENLSVKDQVISFQRS